MESKKLPPSKIKMLAAIEELERAGFAGNADGLQSVLNGTAEEEGFSGFATFGSLLSLKGKACKNRILYLLHNGYLTRTYEAGDYYCRLTERGRAVAEAYLSKPHAKRPIPSKATPARFIRIHQ